MTWPSLVPKLPPLVRVVPQQMVCFSLPKELGVGLSSSGPVKHSSSFA